MKIIKIEKDVKNEFYFVTYKPNCFSKTITDKFRDSGSTYHYFPDVTVFYKNTGEIVGPLSEITTALDNYKRKF